MPNRYGPTLARFAKLAPLADLRAAMPRLDAARAELAPALREAMARLGELKPGAPLCEAARPAAEPPVPEGARFEDLAYRGPEGMLGYRLYVPARRADRPMPLVVMLHGCTQSPEDFAAGTRMNEVAEERGFLVAYPRQTRAANMQRCWNWFDPAGQAGGGEAALIAGMTRAIVRDRGADPTRVYVAGLSAGGAEAAVLAQACPDLFAAAGVHSGLPAGAAASMPAAFAAMKAGADGAPGRAVPTIAFHGDADRTVAAANGEAVVAQGRGGARVSAVATSGRSQGGVGYTRRVESDAAGRPVAELWTLHGVGHAWAGGSPAGTYTDPRGPDASREMARFFLAHRLVAA